MHRPGDMHDRTIVRLVAPLGAGGSETTSDPTPVTMIGRTNGSWMVLGSRVAYAIDPQAISAARHRARKTPTLRRWRRDVAVCVTRPSRSARAYRSSSF